MRNQITDLTLTAWEIPNIEPSSDFIEEYLAKPITVAEFIPIYEVITTQLTTVNKNADVI